jgi:hypothetical protein
MNGMPLIIEHWTLNIEHSFPSPLYDLRPTNLIPTDSHRLIHRFSVAICENDLRRSVVNSPHSALKNTGSASFISQSIITGGYLYSKSFEQ